MIKWILLFTFLIFPLAFQNCSEPFSISFEEEIETSLIDDSTPNSDNKNNQDLLVDESNGESALREEEVEEVENPNPINLPNDLWTITEWQKKFDQMIPAQLRTAQGHSQANDGWRLYNLGYYVDAFNSMYKATGNTQYLEHSLSLIEDVIVRAQPGTQFGSQYNDGYLGWGNLSHPTNTRRNHEFALYESYLWRYVTMTLRYIHEDGLESQYGSQYNDILDFTLKHIYEKWKSRGAHSQFYRSRTHMAAHWAYISMNLSDLIDDPQLKSEFNEIKDRIDYKGMLGQFANASLRSQIKPHPLNPEAYHFDSVWNGSGSQDVAHGNNVISYLVEAYAYGDHWNLKDMQALSLLLTDVLLETPNTRLEFIDGSGQGSGWLNDGFCKLGRYNIEAQRKLQSKSGTTGFQYVAAGALNRWYLENPIEK